jgi:hypothetical protein
MTRRELMVTERALRLLARREGHSQAVSNLLEMLAHPFALDADEREQALPG